MILYATNPETDEAELVEIPDEDENEEEDYEINFPEEGEEEEVIEPFKIDDVPDDEGQ